MSFWIKASMRFFAFVIFVFIFSVSLFSSSVVSAEQGLGLSVEPFLSDLVFEENETEKEFIVTLSNSSQSEIVLDLSAVDFGSLDVSAGVAFLGAARDIEKSYEKAGWISLETDTVTLPAGKTRELHGKLVNTPDLSPGGHYGAVLLSVKEGDVLAMGPASIAVDQRVSALVFLKKRGGERYGMELKNVSRKRDTFGLVRSAEFVFKNTGNVHIAPRGVVLLLDPKDRLVAKGIVNEASSLVLPGAERTFPVTLSPVETAWIPGKYHLRSSYRYDGKEEYEIREESIIIVPSRFLAVLLGVLTLLICGWVLKKQLKKGKIQ